MKKNAIYLLALLLWAAAFTMIALAIDLKAIIKEYAIGWGTLTLINAGIAQGKNKSGLLWFIVSLFLGPVATLLLVITKKESSIQEEKHMRKHLLPNKTQK